MDVGRNVQTTQKEGVAGQDADKQAVVVQPPPLSLTFLVILVSAITIEFVKLIFYVLFYRPL
jgi:hypothetical protein